MRDDLRRPGQDWAWQSCTLAMTLMRSLTREGWQSSTVSQTAIYTVAVGLGSLASGAARASLAVVLTVPDFGAFAFAQALFQYGSLISEFGLFVPAARGAALSQGDDRREILGGALAAYLPVGAVFVIAMLGVSLVVDDIFHVSVGAALRMSAVFAIGWPFTFVGLQLAQGAGKLHLSSIATLIGQVVFLLALVLLQVVWGHIAVDVALIAQSGSLLIAGGLLAVWLKPRFVRVGVRVRELLEGAHRYGFQIYVGRVLAMGTYNMDVLMLGAFTNASAVAYYSLAGAIASSAGLPVTGLAAALFARMTGLPRLDRRWLVAAWGAGFATLPITWGLTRVTVASVFGSRYAPIVGLVIPLCFAQIVRGVTGIYNSFLSAHGRGRELRNAATVLTASNVLLNVLLIPRFGATGAAWASLLALIANWIAHVVGYRQLIGRGPADATHGDRQHTRAAPIASPTDRS